LNHSRLQLQLQTSRNAAIKSVRPAFVPSRVSILPKKRLQQMSVRHFVSIRFVDHNHLGTPTVKHNAQRDATFAQLKTGRRAQSLNHSRLQLQLQTSRNAAIKSVTPAFVLSRVSILRKRRLQWMSVRHFVLIKFVDHNHLGTPTVKNNARRDATFAQSKAGRRAPTRRSRLEQRQQQEVRWPSN